MKIRLLIAAVCICGLPMWSSTSKGTNPTTSTPFAVVAFAGHTTAGNFCECGTPACICDPGEEMTGHSVRATPDSPSNPKAAKAGRGAGFDFGSAAFLMGLAFFLWSRFRA